jgi:small subunit ribosomal protein S16
MGRRHQPFFRICAVDSRAPRDGKVIEELGHYDPLVKETDGRAILKGDRIAYWLGVGAKPSERVATLIRKYGSQGTHLELQRLALERLKLNRPKAPPPMVVPRKKKEEPQPEPPAAEAAEEAPAAPEGETSAAE